MRYVAVSGFALVCALLAGCGSGKTDIPSSPAPPVPSITFQGKVLAGAVAVAGASVQMYAAGSSGNASAADALLGAPVVTDASGKFTITSNDYTCPSASSQIYFIASGGSPGLAGSTTNSALAMMTAWGRCDDLTSSTSIAMNEVTTAAAAWALAPFMSSALQVGATSTNALGLANAFGVANQLADSATGVAPSASLPPNLTVESAKIYSLANALAACTASTGGTPCTNLFTLATVRGAAAPENTVQAALNLVKNPGLNVSAVYASVSATPPYAGLGTAPTDWTMGISITGGGLSSPTNMAIDSTGRPWVANYPGVLSAFTAMGVPVFPSGLTDNLKQVYGITIDPSDNVWVTNGGFKSMSKFAKDGTVLSGASGFSGGGMATPFFAASDTVGNIWVVNYGNSSMTRLSNDGIPAASDGYTGSGTIAFPLAVAVDGTGTPWIANQNGFMTHLSATGSLLQTVSCCSTATGVALDASGNVWGTDYSAGAAVRISAASGTVQGTSTLIGGLLYPNGLAIDGAGTVWVTNYHGSSFSEIAGAAAGSAVGTAISPSTGYGVDVGMIEPFGIAVDGSGSVWMVSSGDDRLIRFVGMATPVKTPLLGLPQLP